jgi:hypothetical protein
MTRTNNDSCRHVLSKRSTYGLDILNLLMADVRDGVALSFPSISKGANFGAPAISASPWR